MANTVHTDTEALEAIKATLLEFSDSIADLQRNFSIYFDYLTEQTKAAIKKKQFDINKKKEVSEEERKSDSFSCSKCGTHMMLKIYGDTIKCRVDGCGGTMRRYHQEPTYTSQELQSEEAKLEEMQQLQRALNIKQDAVMILFVKIFSGDGADTEHVAAGIQQLINKVDDYLNVSLVSEVSNEAKKKQTIVRIPMK